MALASKGAGVLTSNVRLPPLHRAQLPRCSPPGLPRPPRSRSPPECVSARLLSPQLAKRSLKVAKPQMQVRG
jgi:hypothetical protein